MNTLRPLGAAERVFHYYNLANPCAFSFTLHLDTPISEAGLRNAVAGLQRSHPLLRATVSQNETGEPIWVSTTDPVPVRSAPGAELTDVLADEQTRVFTLGPEPLWRVVLLDRAPGDFGDAASSIVVTFDHRITDGMGGIQVLGDLVRVLSGQARPERAIPEAQERLVPRSRAATAQAEAELDPRMTAVGRMRPFDGARPSVDTTVLSREQTARLIAAARAHGVTVQSVLAASATIALAHAGRPYIRIVHPTDLRRRLKLDDEVALRLLLPPQRTGTPADTAGDVWTIAADVKAHLLTDRDLETVGDRVRALESVTPSNPEEATAGMLAISSMDMMISNTGVVRFPEDTEVRCVGLTALSMTVQIAGEVVLGAATFDGRLSLTLTTREDLPGLLEEIVGRL